MKDPIRSFGLALPLSDLDIATSVASGLEKYKPTSRLVSGITARAALDDVLRVALLRPPCLISFSGGRDSSALLAVATRLARAEGLPLPIPVTMQVPGDEASHEEDWQRTVLDHLRLTEWARFSVTNELDAVGPVSTAVLRRHGLLWPFNTYLHQPIIAAATGGSVITGFGGDELARSSQGARAAQVLFRRRRPNPSDALVLGLAASPRPLRRRVLLARTSKHVADLPWLTAAGKQAAAARDAADQLAIPVSWSRTLRSWYPRARYFRVCEASFSRIGESYDVQVLHPFTNPRVLSALAADGGPAGLGNRTALMQHLFGDVLPAKTVERASKATFNNTLYTDIGLAFAQRWSGRGVDSEFVDVERLRRHWLTEPIDARTLTLLQAAWLNDHRERP